MSLNQSSEPFVFSLIIPVYKNEESLPELLGELSKLSKTIKQKLEVVFVVDGSPDRSSDYLKKNLPQASFQSQLILHSRNFGSFPAIRTGLEMARGQFFGVISADLQESPDLVVQMAVELEKGADVVIGKRDGREDPFFQKITALLFWNLYQRWVQSDMPKGGVDLFGINRSVRDHLLALKESNSSLVGLLFWLGFNRKEVSYTRRSRPHGKSAWTFSRKCRYLADSIFAFSDLPIRLMIILGLTGCAFTVLLGFVVLGAKLSGKIPVPGYAATVLTVLFFGGLNSLGLGIVGSYVWRAFENTKGRPSGCVMTKNEFPGTST